MAITEKFTMRLQDGKNNSTIMHAKKSWAKYCRDKAAIVSLVYLLTMFVIAVFAETIAPFDPNAMNFANIMAMPGDVNWLGTDDLGRDVLSRLIIGVETASKTGPLALAIPVMFGIPLGLVSGYLGGIVDEIIMRIVDAMLSIPAILLAIGITGALGASLRNAMLAVGIIFIPQFARLVRGQVLSLREETYVEAARATGASPIRIMLLHILPNAAPPIIVQISFGMGFAILAEASLSFLQLGTQPPSVSWGTMLKAGYSMVYVNPLQLIFPGMLITITVLAFNFVGDGIRKTFDIKSL